MKPTTDLRSHITKNEIAARDDADKAMFDMVPLVDQPPAWLDDTGVAEWERVVPLMKPDVPVSELDAALVANHCQTYADIQHAAALVHSIGLVTPEGKANPAVKQLRDAQALLIRIDEQLGLSLYGRVKLQIKANKPAPADPFAKLVGTR